MPEKTLPKITVNEVLSEIVKLNADLLGHINMDALFGPHRTHSQAEHQKERRRKTLYQGVSKQQNGKWQAQITSGYRRVNKGGFLTQEEAARAYDEMVRKVYGKFAKLNFPDKQDG